MLTYAINPCYFPSTKFQLVTSTNASNYLKNGYSGTSLYKRQQSYSQLLQLSHLATDTSKIRWLPNSCVAYPLSTKLMTLLNLVESFYHWPLARIDIPLSNHESRRLWLLRAWHRCRWRMHFSNVARRGANSTQEFHICGAPGGVANVSSTEQNFFFETEQATWRNQRLPHMYLVSILIVHGRSNFHWLYVLSQKDQWMSFKQTSKYSTTSHWQVHCGELRYLIVIRNASPVRKTLLANFEINDGLLKIRSGKLICWYVFARSLSVRVPPTNFPSSKPSASEQLSTSSPNHCGPDTLVNRKPIKF